MATVAARLAAEAAGAAGAVKDGKMDPTKALGAFSGIAKNLPVPAGLVAGISKNLPVPAGLVAGIANQVIENNVGAASGTTTGTADGTPENAIMPTGANKKQSELMFYDKWPIKGVRYYMSIFAPDGLVDEKNSRILLNVIMLYAINYIYKYKVDKEHYDVLKEIKDYLDIYKYFLKDKISTLSKDYLDIVHDAVEDIKLGDERLFNKQRDDAKMDNETKNADNDRTFKYIKLVVDNSSIISGGLFTTITSAIVNIWRVMMIWSKPFAGLVILVVFIIFIILVFFGEDDSSSSANSGGIGTGSMVRPGNFNFFSNMGGGANNNNTDIISVLQRMPQNIYAFIDKLSVAYSRFSNYVSSSSDLINNLSDTTPIIKGRADKGTGGTGGTEGLYDNIYTFDYKYIDGIKGTENIVDNPPSDLATIAIADKHVYNIKRPKKSSDSNISGYYNISHKDKFDKIGDPAKNEYIYAPKCGTNDYVYDDCTIKNINDCKKAAKEDTSDYKNIII
jgi:hypothetical protein